MIPIPLGKKRHQSTKANRFINPLKGSSTTQFAEKSTSFNNNRIDKSAIVPNRDKFCRTLKFSIQQIRQWRKPKAKTRSFARH